MCEADSHALALSLCTGLKLSVLRLSVSECAILAEVSGFFSIRFRAFHQSLGVPRAALLRVADRPQAMRD